MAFAKDSKERAMFADYYFLCDKYYFADGTEGDDYMDKLMADVGAFVKKHDTETNHFAKRLAGLLIIMIRDRSSGKKILCELGKDVVVDTILRRLK